tara:strand:- start:10476 stop:10814 length:339 start_codon:yes stop_codon:yes gene_type:complete
MFPSWVDCAVTTTECERQDVVVTAVICTLLGVIAKKVAIFAINDGLSSESGSTFTPMVLEMTHCTTEPGGMGGDGGAGTGEGGGMGDGIDGGGGGGRMQMASMLAPRPTPLG